MKRGIVAGAVAGLAGGIAGVLFAAIGSQLGIFRTPPNITPTEFTIY
jgi:hypothetical protein